MTEPKERKPAKKGKLLSRKIEDVIPLLAGLKLYAYGQKLQEKR